MVERTDIPDLQTPAPRVSVIVPTFNRLEYLRPAIESVFAQSFQDWELIVADDGSSEDTKAYLRTIEQLPRVQVLWLPHAGNHCRPRNAALQVARGEYIAFLDSDDYWLPQKLEIQIAALSRSVRRWSYTAFTLVDADGKPLATEPHRRWTAHSGAIFERLLKHEAVVTVPTVVATRELIAQAGGFNENQLSHADYDLWFRMALLSEVDALETSLACVRKHREHYNRCGIRPPLARHQILERLHASLKDARLRSLVQTERAWNAVSLSGLYATEHNGPALFRTLRSSWPYSWWRIRWWWGAARSVLRLSVPDRMAALYRRFAG